MSEQTNIPEPDREMTPEELKAYKDQQHKYYKESIPFLKTTLEYERLIADIEEARLKYYTMRMRIATMLAPPPPPQEGEDPTPGEHVEGQGIKKERKLKTNTD